MQVSPNLHENPSTELIKKGQGRIPGGEVGIWIFIFGDMLVFGILFCTFLYARGQDPALFRLSQEHLNTTYALINTLLLLTSSLCVVKAVRIMNLDKKNGASSILLLIAIGCGVAFCILKYLEYSQKISVDFILTTNDFWMYYYVLTGLHLLHVLLGLVFLIFCFAQTRSHNTTSGRYQLVEGAACFWHMVDLLWIVLFPLIYLVR